MTKNNVVELKNPASDADPLHDLLREGARTLLQRAIDAECELLLEQYTDYKTDNGRAAVVRNGYLPEREIQTGIGPISVKVPKVRSKMEESVKFNSTLVPPYVRKARRLEAALPWLYLKGISTGDMSDALEVLVGPEAKGLSASTVSRLKTKWADDYKAFQTQRLDKNKWVYIWADGIYSHLRGDNSKLCALVIIGVDTRGEKHFLSIEDGTRESTQSWREILLSLKERGLNMPRLAIADGAMGFWAALAEVFPETKQQRCWMHKTCNVLNYLPKSSQPKAKEKLQNIWRAETKELADKAFKHFVTVYEAKYPKATACLEKDKESLMCFYDFPAMHWQSIRTSNPIESAFGTIRHRTKGAKGCLSRDKMLHMLYQLGMCAEERWNRLRGFNHLADVIEGVKFKDGKRVTLEDSQVAA